MKDKAARNSDRTRRRLKRRRFTRMSLRKPLAQRISHAAMVVHFAPTPRTAMTDVAIPRSNIAHLRAELNDIEKYWHDKQPFLERRGYALRPRLRPGWTPSWFTNGKMPQRCEDFWRILVSVVFEYDSTYSNHVQPYSNLVDATRIADDRQVYIKKVQTNDAEMSLALSLSRRESSDDPRNHCVPILDVFADDTNPKFTYLVMPLLRHVDNPSFDFVDDVVDFLDQILEVSKSYAISCWRIDPPFRDWFSYMNRVSPIGECASTCTQGRC